MEVKAVTKSVYFADSPIWAESEQALYYVDVFSQNICRYHPEKDLHTVLHIDDGPITSAIPHAKRSGVFVVTAGRKVLLVQWPNPEINGTAKDVKQLALLDADHRENRINEAKSDAFGRLWAGTMGNTSVSTNLQPLQGTLFLLNKDGKLSPIIEKISITNGFDWDYSNKKFYLVDSCTYSVYSFDFDQVSEDSVPQLRNQRVVFDYNENGISPPAFPDGITVDKSGRLWIASYGAAKLHCVDPMKRQVDREIELPAPNITSVAWGGNDFSDLYVTTARRDLSDEELLANPLSGSVFRIRGLNASGYRPVPCIIGTSGA